MKKMSSYLIVLISVCTSTCHLQETDEPVLPPITMSGEDTFGCVINGQVWIPTGSYQVDPVSADNSTDLILTILANGPNRGMDFLLRKPIIVGRQYSVLNTDSVRVTYGNVYSNESGCFYHFENMITGHITFSKFDTQLGIISGTFEFTALKNECSKDTLKVKQGRFDISKIL